MSSQLVPAAARVPRRAVRERELRDDLGVCAVDVLLRDAVLAQERAEVGDPLAVDGEADLRLVDEVVGEQGRVVPARFLDRLADLPVRGDGLVRPGTHAYPAAENR